MIDIPTYICQSMYLKEHRKSGFWISVFGYRAIVVYKQHIVHCLHCTVINKLYRQTIDTVFTVWNIVILFSVFGLHFFDLKVHSSSSQQIITLSGFLKRQYFAFYDTLATKQILFHCVVEQLVNCHVGLLKIVHVPQTISWGVIQFNPIKRI